MRTPPLLAGAVYAVPLVGGICTPAAPAVRRGQAAGKKPVKGWDSGQTNLPRWRFVYCLWPWPHRLWPGLALSGGLAPAQPVPPVR